MVGRYSDVFVEVEHFHFMPFDFLFYELFEEFELGRAR